MLNEGDIVRVRRYEDIPEHPIYSCKWRHGSYFGISKSKLDSLSEEDEMTVIAVIRDKNQHWYDAASEECKMMLTQNREPVYKINAKNDNDRHLVFLENMLEPVCNEPLEMPDAEEFFASLF